MSAKPDKKEIILDAAEQLFALKGYEGSSVREICQLASVNLAMVNYYFGNKEGLFEKLIDRKVSFLRDKLQQLLDNPDMSYIEKVDAFADGYTDRLFERRGLSLTIMREMSMQQRCHFHETMGEIFLGNVSIMRQIINKGIEAGQFRPVDVELTIATLMGTILQVLVNESMVRKLSAMDEHVNPYDDESFRNRVKSHIRQLLRSYLVKV
ncbi:MAG: TetR family transcriptional regulator [Flavihumibacter sp.]